MKKSLAVLSVSALLVLAGCAPSGELASSNSESTPESISTSSVESASSVPEESSEEDPYSWPASSYETISIAEAKKVEEGTEVTVRGRIMRHLKTSSGYTAYLWLSDGEGISVYPPKSTTYDVKEGQLITVKGKYSVCKGLPEISEPTILETFDMPYNVPEDYVEGTSAIPELLALEVAPENVGKIYKTSAIVSDRKSVV